MHIQGIVGPILAMALLTGGPSLHCGAGAADPEQVMAGPMPPRLSLVEGQVSFWRPEDQAWAPAQVNTPLAPGDQLATGPSGSLELQVGGHAFVRLGDNSRLGLDLLEAGFLRLSLTAGQAALDLRMLEVGRTLEVTTPNAIFLIAQPGYYRLDIAGERTAFLARQAGRVAVTPAGGSPFTLASDEEAVIEGSQYPDITVHAAPPPDAWDRWNLARSDALREAASARYLAPGTYGTADLDRHGTWQTVPPYGPVWVPAAVPVGWVPYSTGSWVRDPFYGWTWVDTAPWGWAPYHHGRWVVVSGHWAWAPGPRQVRPVYAPALVAFFDGPGISVGIGGRVVGWVALGWGEPCVPWWGPAGFIQRPWWGGWSGPRVVNNVVVPARTVVRVQQIRSYRNAAMPHAVVVTQEERFGHGRIAPVSISSAEARRLPPSHAAPRTAAPAPVVLPSPERREASRDVTLPAVPPNPAQRSFIGQPGPSARPVPPAGQGGARLTASPPTASPPAAAAPSRPGSPERDSRPVQPRADSRPVAAPPAPAARPEASTRPIAQEQPTAPASSLSQTHPAKPSEGAPGATRPAALPAPRPRPQESGASAAPTQAAFRREATPPTPAGRPEASPRTASRELPKSSSRPDSQAHPVKPAAGAPPGVPQATSPQPRRGAPSSPAVPAVKPPSPAAPRESGPPAPADHPERPKLSAPPRSEESPGRPTTNRDGARSPQAGSPGRS